MRIFLMMCVVFLSCPAIIFAQSSRDRIIKKEFDCIRNQQSQTIVWDDVCYASMDTRSSKKRQEVINHTLDAVSSQMEPQQSNDLANDKSGAANQRSSDEAPAQYFDLTREQSEHQDSNQPNQLSLNPSQPSKVSEPSADSGSAGVKLKKHQFEFGPEIFSYHYKEPSLTVDIKGTMYGFYGLYEFRPDKNSNIVDDVLNMYKLDARFAYGLVDYSSDPSGKSNNIDDYSVEFRGAAGYDFFITPKTLITPSAGLGFRYLYDGGSGTKTDLGFFGYDRVSHYLYAPFGFDFLNQPNNNWQLGFNLEADLLLWGRQDSYLSDVNSTLYGDLRNRQRKGFGLRGALKLIKKTETVNFIFEPFIRYWHIKSSDTSVAISNGGFRVAGLEPDNNTTEFGVKLGVQY